MIRKSVYILLIFLYNCTIGFGQNYNGKLISSNDTISIYINSSSTGTVLLSALTVAIQNLPQNTGVVISNPFNLAMDQDSSNTSRTVLLNALINQTININPSSDILVLRIKGNGNHGQYQLINSTDLFYIEIGGQNKTGSILSCNVPSIPNGELQVLDAICPTCPIPDGSISIGTLSVNAGILEYSTLTNSQWTVTLPTYNIYSSELIKARGKAGEGCVGPDKIVGVTKPSQPFISLWKSDNPGVSNSNELSIPFIGNYIGIKWENISNPNDTGNILLTSVGNTISFSASGEYIIKISGSYNQIQFNNGGDKSKITKILDWGSQTWSSYENAFWGCDNLILETTSKPTFTSNNSVENMFKNCSMLKDDDNIISSWQTQNITNFKGMFSGATLFDENLGAWSITNAIDMTNMLDQSGLSCEKYDSTLTGWANNPTTPNNITLGAVGLNYWLSDYYRSNLIVNKGWTILGDNSSICNYSIPCGPIIWIGNNGEWGNPSNWDLKILPQPCHDVFINNINDECELSVNQNANIRSLVNRGNFYTSTNSSLIIMSSVDDGLMNLGGLIENNGAISIIRPNGYGLVNADGAHLINYGDLNIMDSGGPDIKNENFETIISNYGKMEVVTSQSNAIQNLMGALIINFNLIRVISP